MKDCELCESFKWEKEKSKFGKRLFDVPKCKLKNIEIKSPKMAENCEDFK